MQNATRRCIGDLPAPGLVAFQPIKVRHIDGTQGAGLVARKWEHWQADACFIDDTGGFGSSWIDNLRRLGREPIGIAFSGRALAPWHRSNDRVQPPDSTSNWIKVGGNVKPKDQVKARLGYSPDDADAFALTFAQPVAARDRYYVDDGGGGDAPTPAPGRAITKYDVLKGW